MFLHILSFYVDTNAFPQTSLVSRNINDTMITTKLFEFVPPYESVMILLFEFR